MVDQPKATTPSTQATPPGSPRLSESTRPKGPRRTAWHLVQYTPLKKNEYRKFQGCKPYKSPPVLIAGCNNYTNFPTMDHCPFSKRMFSAFSSQSSLEVWKMVQEGSRRTRSPSEIVISLCKNLVKLWFNRFSVKPPETPGQIPSHAASRMRMPKPTEANTTSARRT